jgi:hypothetical protein
MVMMDMRKQERAVIAPGQQTELKPGVLFQKQNVRFALKSYVPRGRITAVPAENISPEVTLYSAIIMNVIGKKNTRQIALFGGAGMEGVPERISIDGTEVTMAYGAVSSSLPFQLRLNDFIIERYPGSRMPSTYESRVTILDEVFGIEEPYRIYMNHILKYRGYRFYQTSYDEDEKGSILSVSRDPGTPVTYAGYAILIIGLIVNLFHPKSRFGKLGGLLKKPVVSGLAAALLFTQSLCARPKVDIDKRHADRFARLMVQDTQGRMKPVHSLATELLRDLGHPERALDLSPSQWILLVYTQPDSIQHRPVIPLEHEAINRRLGLPLDVKFSPPASFYQSDGQPILKDRIRRAEAVPR